MILKDFIAQLQKIEDSFDQEYRDVMGEPDIVIDIFGEIGNTNTFQYKGISTDIRITPSADGCYATILTAFEPTKEVI